MASNTEYNMLVRLSGGVCGWLGTGKAWRQDVSRVWRCSCCIGRVFAVAVLLLATSVDGLAQVASGDGKSQKTTMELEAFLEEVRKESDLPAIWAGKFRHDGSALLAASGVRKIETDVEVEVDDLIHLGSCTKAMTAVLVARAISNGDLKWETTLAEIFPNELLLVASSWNDVTVDELLRHRSGCPANALWSTLNRQTPGDPVAARREMLRWLAEKPRPASRGYLYSNVGYALLGHIVETVEGKPWQLLIQSELFQPLGIESAGFGPVKGDGKTDQPWGHVREPSVSSALKQFFGAAGESSALKAIQLDNAPPLGPAGRVHMSLRDWSRFTRLFATGEPELGKLGIARDIWQRLLEPADDEVYAGGWNVLERDWAGGRVYNHAGSNTTWYCVAWVAPGNEYAILVATNAFTPDAATACDRVAAELIGW